MKHIETELGGLGKVESEVRTDSSASKDRSSKMPTKLKSLWRRKGRSPLTSGSSNVRWASSLNLGRLN